MYKKKKIKFFFTSYLIKLKKKLQGGEMKICKFSCKL